MRRDAVTLHHAIQRHRNIRTKYALSHRGGVGTGEGVKHDCDIDCCRAVYVELCWKRLDTVNLLVYKQASAGQMAVATCGRPG